MVKPATFGPSNRLRINLIFLCAAIILCLYFTQMRLALNITFEGATPERLVEGSAPYIFQTRILIPLLVRGLLALPFVPPESLDTVFMAIELLALILLLYAFRTYLQLLFKDLLTSSILAFTIFYALPFNYFFNFWYPSDIPSVLFFTLGLIMLYRRKWILFYPLLAIATINREVTLFLVFIYVVTSLGRRPLDRIALHTIAQLVVWGIARYLAIELAGKSASGLLYLNLTGNIANLRRLTVLLWIPVSGGMTWLLALIGNRSIKDMFVRRALLVIFPWVAVMFLVASVKELRIYGELIPVTLPAALLVLQSLLRAGQGQASQS